MGSLHFRGGHAPRDSLDTLKYLVRFCKTAKNRLHCDNRAPASRDAVSLLLLALLRIVTSAAYDLFDAHTNNQPSKSTSQHTNGVSSDNYTSELAGRESFVRWKNPTAVHDG